jgi:uncharacterized membrane-anchored protein YhcB (DUF1043 family)
MTVAELTEKKEQLTADKGAVERLKGKLDHLKQELKDKFKVTSASEARELLKNKQNEYAKLKEQYNKDCEEFLQEYHEYRD